MERKSPYNIWCENLERTIKKSFLDRLISYRSYMYGLIGEEELECESYEKYLEELKKSTKESEIPQIKEKLELHRESKRSLDRALDSLYIFFPELKPKEEKK